MCKVPRMPRGKEAGRVSKRIKQTPLKTSCCRAAIVWFDPARRRFERWTGAEPPRLGWCEKCEGEI